MLAFADANGASVPGAAATIAIARVSSAAHGTVSKPVCNTKPTTGTAFSYNSTTKQHLYYLGTSGLKAGDYKVTASLDDGTQIVGQFSLKWKGRWGRGAATRSHPASRGLGQIADGLPTRRLVRAHRG